MDWIDDVNARMKRKNQILFSKEIPILQELSILLENQNRRTIVLWALDLSGDCVRELFEKYPLDDRPIKALEEAKRWAAGEIKMPVAKKAILNCHSMAKEMDLPEDEALCHAVGQACSTVHTKRHAMGLPIYELTAIVKKYGIENCREPIEKRCAQYIDKLIYWRDNLSEYKGTWAKFMMKE